MLTMVQYELTAMNLGATPVYTEALDCTNAIAISTVVVNDTDKPVGIHLECSMDVDFAECKDMGGPMQVVNGGAAKITIPLDACCKHIRVRFIHTEEGAPMLGTVTVNALLSKRPVEE